MQLLSFRSCLSAALLCGVASFTLGACSSDTNAPATAEDAAVFIQRVETELSEVS